MTIEEIAENTYRLEKSVSGGSSYASYLIRGQGAVIIETGPAVAIPMIMEGMGKLGIETVSYIIPTHIHVDHGGGVGRLARLLPGAIVVLHPESVRHVLDPSRLIRGTKMVFGDDFEVRLGPILPVPESQVKVAVDEEVICAGDIRLKIIHTPGHAPHHISIFDQNTRGLFCGEALGTPLAGFESWVLPGAAPPNFDVTLYFASIEKQKRLAPRLLFYSHDGVGREVNDLISSVAENTRIFGEVILQALKEGVPPDAIGLRVAEYVSARIDMKIGESGLKNIVNGYVFYFRKQGLV